MTNHLFKYIIKACLLYILILNQGCSDVHRWENLPVGIMVTTEREIKVIEKINDFFGTDIFENSEHGIPIYYVERLGGLAHTDWGWENGIIYDGWIELDETLSGNDFEIVFAHELGHILGAKHTEIGLMNPHQDQSLPLEDHLAGHFENWVIETYPEYFD